MRVLLVNMPWAALEVPSLALGILRGRVVDAVPGSDVEVCYANIAFTDWASERIGYSVPSYNHVAQATYFIGVGDWVFSSALYGDPYWREAEFVASRRELLPPERLQEAVALHRLVPEFVDELVTQWTAARPDVVGFTSTFQQNTAALAAAREVKRRLPSTVTVFGGANCDGEPGATLHRTFPFVDFVCRGEAETSFTALLTALRDGDGTAYREIPGLCWRDRERGAVVNDLPRRPLPPGQIGVPDFTDFFAQLAASKTGAVVEPRLVVEGSRGCWWGAKQHCTFCGLNGSSMQFRSKPPERFSEEVLGLVERYQVLDLFVVDNILDMAYLSTALPVLAEADYDLRMIYEIKSNLRYDQLAMLSRSGASTVQPGIENLSSRVLQLMRKGVSGCHNVRLLRDAESVGLTLVWNYLYGFPGEVDEDYRDVLAQFGVLHHLYPPSSANRIAVERFSPYFADPDLGFPLLAPDEQYRITYDLPVSELMDLAYLFEAAPCGIGAAMAAEVDEATRHWRHSYPAARFCWYEHDGAVTLVNTRPAVPWSTRCLTDPVEVAAFRALDQPRTAASLARAVTAAVGSGGGLSPTDAAALLGEWRALGIVFEEADRFLHVATLGANQDLFRRGHYQYLDSG